MNEIENKAMQKVFEHERKCKRNPKDVSKDKKEIGYDIQSDERKIEVNGFGGRDFITFSDYNLKAFRNQSNFYLYIVFDIKTNPRLIIWNKLEVAERIKEAKKHFHLEIPLRKKDGDNGKFV